MVSIRLDDLLPRRLSSASNATIAGAGRRAGCLAEFLLRRKTSRGLLLRGRMGYRNGDLMMKGEGFDARHSFAERTGDRLEACTKRSRSACRPQGGAEVKIRSAISKVKQKLGPCGTVSTSTASTCMWMRQREPSAGRHADRQPHRHRRDPFDQADTAAWRDYPQPSGRRSVGKQDEYRNAIYMHSPSALTFNVAFRPGMRACTLRHGHHGERDAPSDSGSRWKDADASTRRRSAIRPIGRTADVDLSAYGGRKVKLTLTHGSSACRCRGAMGKSAHHAGAMRRRRPNVLVYMIDTMRADHASLYGYPRDTTPFLKKLAASGMWCSTMPGAGDLDQGVDGVSLMTSLYSFTHGIVGDADTHPR